MCWPKIVEVHFYDASLAIVTANFSGIYDFQKWKGSMGELNLF